MKTDVRVEFLKRWIAEVRDAIASDPEERQRSYALSLLRDALLFTPDLSEYQVKVAFELFERVVSGSSFGSPEVVRADLRTLRFSLNPKPKCVWCEGSGTISVSGLVCRTCSGTGESVESLDTSPRVRR